MHNDENRSDGGFGARPLLWTVCAAFLVCGAALAQGPPPLGEEFQVNTYTTGSQSQPAVAMDSESGFVVVFGSPQDGSGRGIFGRLFDSSGKPTSGEFPVNTHTPGAQERPAVARDAAGNFVVVWESDSQDGSSHGVLGRRFDADGDPLGGEFQVNTYTTGS